jgi:hypothetical protein
MSQRGKAAKTGGPPKGAAKQPTRKTRSVQKSSVEKGPGAARTVQDGRRNEQIQAEWRNGREPDSLATEFGLSERRVYEIIKQCREGRIEALELDAPWRDQAWADELLLYIRAALNETREIQIRARRQGNTASELGALKVRMQLLRELTTFLQETGRLTGLRELKDEAERAEVWNGVRRVFGEGLISNDGLVAIARALGLDAGSEEGRPPPLLDPPPEHWLPNRTERRIAEEREREAARREDLEARLEIAEQQATEQREAANRWETAYRETPEAQREAEEKLAAARGERLQRNRSVRQERTEVEQPPHDAETRRPAPVEAEQQPKTDWTRWPEVGQDGYPPIDL